MAVVPRFLDKDRGATPAERQVSTEVDLDTLFEHDEQQDRALLSIAEDVKWIKRLLIGSFASTTFAAVLLAAQSRVH